MSLAVSPPTEIQNNILFVLFMQAGPYDCVREGCGDGVRATSQWQLFIQCGKLFCHFDMLRPQKGAPKNEAATITFYSFHLASSRYCIYSMSGTMFSSNRRLQISCSSPSFYHAGIQSQSNTCDSAMEMLLCSITGYIFKNCATQPRTRYSGFAISAHLRPPL